MNNKGVRCGNHGKDRVYHRDASEVKDCYAGRFDDDGAYEAEMAYERHLENAGWAEAQAQRDWEDRNGVIQFGDAMRAAERESGWATAAQERDYAEREACSGLPPAPRQPKGKLTQDGMYRDPASGRIWKVQFNRASGDGQRLYAKLLVIDIEPEVAPDGKVITTGKRHFDYAPGAMREIRPEWRMSLEEAKEFGALYGTCVYGHPLTKEESIRKGIGPVCEEKYGMPR